MRKGTVSINISDPSLDRSYARTEIMVRQTQRSKQCGKVMQEQLLTNDHNGNIIKNWPKFQTHPLIEFMQGRI